MLKYKIPVSRRIELALSRIQPPEFESVVGRSQLQLTSSHQNSSQPWDGVSCNSYQAPGTRVSRGTESVATRIQPLEPKSAVEWSQP